MKQKSGNNAKHLFETSYCEICPFIIALSISLPKSFFMSQKHIFLDLCFKTENHTSRALISWKKSSPQNRVTLKQISLAVSNKYHFAFRIMLYQQYTWWSARTKPFQMFVYYYNILKVKPVLITTSEQRPPVNNVQPESPTQLKELHNLAPSYDQQPPFERLSLFESPKVGRCTQVLVTIFAYLRPSGTCVSHGPDLSHRGSSFLAGKDLCSGFGLWMRRVENAPVRCFGSVLKK